MKSESGNDGNSLGALYWGFMKYYSEFDFRKNWISVQRGAAMEKRRDEEKSPLDGLPVNNLLVVVEDPFMDPPFNCARTLRQSNIYERMKKEFQVAEETIRTQHKLPIGKTNKRICIEQEGRSRDNQVVELELELDRIFWEDRELLKGRVERQKPYEFYVAEKSMKEFWPEVTPMMFL